MSNAVSRMYEAVAARQDSISDDAAAGLGAHTVVSNRMPPFVHGAAHAALPRSTHLPAGAQAMLVLIPTLPGNPYTPGSTNASVVSSGTEGQVQPSGTEASAVGNRGGAQSFVPGHVIYKDHYGLGTAASMATDFATAQTSLTTANASLTTAVSNQNSGSGKVADFTTAVNNFFNAVNAALTAAQDAQSNDPNDTTIASAITNIQNQQAVVQTAQKTIGGLTDPTQAAGPATSAQGAAAVALASAQQAVSTANTFMAASGTTTTTTTPTVTPVVVPSTTTTTVSPPVDYTVPILVGAGLIGAGIIGYALLHKTKPARRSSSRRSARTYRSA